MKNAKRPKKGIDQDLISLAAAMEVLAGKATDLARFAATDARAARLVRDAHRAYCHATRCLFQRLDPIQLPGEVFDPSAPASFAETIAERLALTPARSLEDLPEFYGSGIYALYYCGDYPAYERIRGSSIPIYVGKADPVIFDARTPFDQGTSLSTRIRDHERSVSAVEQFAKESGAKPSLRVADMRCRTLVLDSAWQAIAENLLIRRFRPVWNKEIGICQGFGKHGDSAKTRANRRSDWDTLHPGRRWATKDGNVEGRSTAVEIVERVIAHCAHYQKNGRFVSGAAPDADD